MRAVLYDRFGGAEVLRVAEVSTPEPARGELQVRVRAASVNPVDWKIREGRLSFIMSKKFPKGLGGDFSGVVTKIGEGVSSFKPGDEVFGNANQTKSKIGSYADILCVPQDRVTIKPAKISHEQAASLPTAAASALQAMREVGRLREGGSVLINGASGGVGSFAVQIARILKYKSTAFCGPENTELVKKLGADRVFDYHKISPEKLAEAPDEKFDLFFDVVPASSFLKAKKMLKAGGVYVTTYPTAPAAVLMGTNLFRRKKARIFMLKNRPSDLALLAEWVSVGQLTPILGANFTLSEIRQAHELSETVRARGKIIITP